MKPRAKAVRINSCWKSMSLSPAPVAGLAQFLVALLGEVLFEIASGAAGDDNHLGAVAVGAGAG